MGLAFFYAGFAALFAVPISVPETASRGQWLWSDRGTVLGLIAISLPIIGSISPLPLSYADCAVRSGEPDTVREHLSDLNVRTEAEVGAVGSAISDLEEGARKRVTALRWLALILWAVSGFFAARYFDGLLTSPHGVEARAYFDFTVMLLLGTLLVYLLTQSYSAAVDRAYKAIKFALYNLFVEVASRSETDRNLYPGVSPNGSQDTDGLAPGSPKQAD